MTKWNDQDQFDEQMDGQMGDSPGGFGAPPSMDDTFAADDFEKKINRGNTGFLLAMLGGVILAVVFGVIWYKNNAEAQEWRQQFDAAMKLPDGEFEAALRKIVLECPTKSIVAQSVFELGVAKDKGAVPVLVKALEQGGTIAQEAALALAKIGGPEAKASTDAILKLMNETKEMVQVKYAWALVSLGDERGFETLLEGINRQWIKPDTLPEYDKELVAQMATTDRLIQLSEAPDPMLKMYAAMELGFRDDKDPVPALLKLLADESKEVAQEAAVSLGRTGDDRAGKALLDKIRTAPELLDPILSAVTQSVGAPGLEVIYDNATDPAVKYKILGRIKGLNDPRSANLLLKIVDEEFPGSDDKAKLEADEIRNQALWTLEELGEPRAAEKMFAKTQWETIDPDLIPDEAVRYRQEDMSRKIANGVVTWIGETNPPGASAMLKKIYDANSPYTNTPECAKRVKVDIGPLMDAMGRTGDKSFCPIIKPFLTKEDRFYIQAASHALARLKCDGIVAEFKKMMMMSAKERKEEKFSPLMEGRDWQMEGRLQERRNTIMATRYIGDPAFADNLMTIALDPMDDQELRAEAAASLAYVADDKAMSKIIEKVQDESVDTVARAALIQGLWHNSSQESIEAMMSLLEGSGKDSFVKAAAIAVGEAGDPAYAERLNKLLDHSDENRQRAAVFAILLGGNSNRTDRIIEILEGQESRLIIRRWFEEHPLYLSRDMFTSKRLFRRLQVARDLSDRTSRSTDQILWPWKYLMDRITKGWDTSPGGLNKLQVRQMLVETIRNDAESRDLAMRILAGLGERGYLLALQADDDKTVSDLARATLKAMNLKSE